MALLQGPVLYYYGVGFRVMFILYPYMLIGLSLSVYMLIKLKEKKTNTPFMRWGVIAGILLGIISLASEDVFEYIDWHLRRSTRNEIVEQVKQGNLKGGKLSGRNFPPISNDQNNIYVEKPTDKTVSVTFYINPGFLDHYSAFVYTNDPEEQKDVEEWVSSGKREGFAKLDTNWYRVNY